MIYNIFITKHLIKIKCYIEHILIVSYSQRLNGKSVPAKIDGVKS